MFPSLILLSRFVYEVLAKKNHNLVTKRKKESKKELTKKNIHTEIMCTLMYTAFLINTLVINEKVRSKH